MKKNKLKDISNIGADGKTSYELKINSNDNLDYFMDLFKQVYKQKRE